MDAYRRKRYKNNCPQASDRKDVVLYPNAGPSFNETGIPGDVFADHPKLPRKLGADPSLIVLKTN